MLPRAQMFHFYLSHNSHTMVGDNINIMKTTFDFNFSLYQAFIQHGYTKKHGNKENLKALIFN